MNHHSLSIARRCSLALAVAALGTPMLANAHRTPDMDIYRQQRAECLRLGYQSKADCEYEARSVLRDMRMGKLQRSEDPLTLERNARARCDSHPVDERASCMRMIQGASEREGSLAEGGSS